MKDNFFVSEEYGTFTNSPQTEKYKSDVPVIDQILEEKGYCSFTYKHILLTFLVLAVEGLHMSLFSSMIIPLTNLYGLRESDIKFLSSVLFIGVGFGSLISGSITSKYSRTLVINTFLAVICISNVLLAVSNNYFIFAFFRVLIGIGLGLIVPMSLNLLTECLPITNRSLVLTCIWIAFGVGNMFNLLVMLRLMPYLEAAYVKETLLICSLCPLIAFLANYYYLNDSPRNLILNSSDDKAINILEGISKEKIDDLTRSRIIAEVRTGTEIESNESIQSLFVGKYKKLTVLLTLIWFFNSMIGYGPALISSLTIKELGMSDSFSNYEIIINQIVICIICSPSCYVGGLLSEIPCLGRNKSTILGYTLSVFFMTLAIVFPEFYTLCFALSQAFGGIAFNINTTYTCEIYSTKVRDNALGFLFFATRVGGFLSQILYIGLNESGVWVPYIFTIIITVVNIGFIASLPFETLGQPLDMDYFGEDVDEEKRIIKK